MTQPPATAPAPEAAARDAETAAATAARRAGVTVRDLTSLAELRAVYALIGEIWQPDPANPPVTTDLMRALTKAGNYLSGVYQGERLVGACVAFLAAPAGRALHSHAAGVTAALRGRDVGFALKLHQRAWALARGLDHITWTFDPLIRRNAYFNLVKLGARPEEYLPDFYGAMEDAVNRGDQSDRVLLHWQLDDPQVVRACDGHRAEPDPATLRGAGATTGLRVGADGGPVIGDTGGAVVLVGLPPDVERLRRTDPAAARAWRQALRKVLGGLMAQGGRVTGFGREVGYIVERR